MFDCSFIAQLPGNGGTAVAVDPGASDRLAGLGAATGQRGLESLVCERAVEVKLTGQAGSHGEVKLFWLDDEFVIEFPVGSRDVDQRAVRLMCYGAASTPATSDDVVEAADRLDQFVTRNELSKHKIHRHRFEDGIRLATEPPRDARKKLDQFTQDVVGMAKGMRPFGKVADSSTGHRVSPSSQQANDQVSYADTGSQAIEDVADDDGREHIDAQSEAASMWLSEIPPHNRRLLLVGSDADFANIGLNKDSRALFLNDAFTFVNTTQVAEYIGDPILQRMQAADQLRAGVLLVLSPLAPHLYLTLDTISEDMAERKIRTTVEACHRLGARSITIRQAVRRTSSNEEQWSAEGSITGHGAAGASATTVTFASGSFRYESTWELDGGEPDPDGACEVLVAGGMADDMVADLVRLVRSGNRPRSHKLTISTESEMQRTRHLVGNISVPFMDTQAAIKQFMDTRQAYKFELMIEF